MVLGVVIPADENEPVRLENFGNFQDYQRVVDGTFQALDLDSLAASLFVNEEGKLMGLESNKRATVIWWATVKGTINHDVIVGDVVLVGLPDEEGDTQPAPAEFVCLINHTGRFRVEFVRERYPAETRITRVELTNWVDAFEYAIYLNSSYPDLISTKVVPF